MKPKTTTEVVTKALARSGPEITPEQIRLADDAQPDKNKVYTQRDYNESVSGGGGGGVAPDLKDYAKTDYVDSADNALGALIAANTQAIEDIEIPEGGIAPDLDGYAKTEYVDAGDAALDGKIAQVAKDLDAVENDYTTTDEFNTLNSKVSQNKKDIASLGDAFDTAVLAAQEGADKLEIELQSYAKKEDIPEGAETPTLDAVCQKGAVTTATIGCSGLSTTGVIDAHCKWHDVPYANFQGSDAKADLTIQDRVVTVGDTTRSEAATLNVHGTVNATEFVGDGSKLTGLPSGSSVRYPIKEVLAEGNQAEAGQTLHFRVKESEIPDIPFTRGSIDIEGGSGFRLGGLVSYYTMNAPFSIDTGSGNVTEFDNSVCRLSAADAYYHGDLDGTYCEGSVGITGLQFWSNQTGLSCNHYGFNLRVGEDSRNPLLSIRTDERETTPGTWEPFSVVQATEFIGDGSKLTNLPTSGAAAPALPGHKWKLIPYSAAEKPGPGEFMHDDSTQSYYFNATDADGVVFGNPLNVFDAYSVNGTMLVSLYKQGTGIEGIFKAAAVALKTELDKTYFHIVEANHQRLNLQEGQTYNVVASGLF